MTLPPPFNARIIPGRGRGKTLRAPTLNLDLADVPLDLEEGIYACWVKSEELKISNPSAPLRTSQKSVMGLAAAMHYGPRPVFNDIRSCEVHILDEQIETPPAQLEVNIVKYLREIRNFASPEALAAQIQQDIEQIRAILDAA